MAKEIVFSTTKELEYHFLYGKPDIEVDRFVSITHNSLASSAFAKGGCTSFFVVKDFAEGLLFGSYVNVSAFARKGQFKSEYASCIRGGDANFPVYAFVGWLIEHGSEEECNQRYIDISYEFVVQRLEAAFQRFFFSNVWPPNKFDVDVPLPYKPTLRRNMMPYANALTKKNVKNASVQESDLYFVFNMLVNCSLACARQNFSALLGIHYVADEFDINILLSDNPNGKWLMQSNVMSKFFLKLHKDNRGVKITSKARRILGKLARFNEFLLQRFATLISDYAVSRQVKIVTDQMVVDYFVSRKLATLEGLLYCDIIALKLIAGRSALDPELSYYSLPFLMEKGYVSISKEQVLLKQRGWDILHFLREGDL